MRQCSRSCVLALSARVLISLIALLSSHISAQFAMEMCTAGVLVVFGIRYSTYIITCTALLTFRERSRVKIVCVPDHDNIRPYI